MLFAGVDRRRILLVARQVGVYELDQPVQVFRRDLSRQAGLVVLPRGIEDGGVVLTDSFLWSK